MHPGIEQFVPESKVYTQLLECEKRVDAVLDARATEIQEALQPQERARKRLRVYLHNTYANQPTGGGEESKREPPSWALRISGRLLERSSEYGGHRSGRKKPFSSFIKHLEVELDPEQYPGASGRIKWVKPEAAEGKDAFEIRRTGQKDVRVVLKMVLDDQVPKSKLVPGLAALLGVHAATRPQILSLLWTYITLNKLQLPHDPGTIQCDKHLAALFGGAQTVQISSLSNRLGALLSPCEAITLNHIVKVSGPNPTFPLVLDVDVDLPVTPNIDKLDGCFERASKDKEIASLNHKIKSSIQKIDEHRRRRSFFLGFAHSPVDFINAILVSQSRDLRDARTADRQDFELDKRTDLFKGRWVEDAVVKYLQRRLAGGH